MKLTNFQRFLALSQVQGSPSKAAVARRFNVTERTIRNLMIRYRQTGKEEDPKINSKHDFKSPRVH